ncbi:hypothetical protein HOY80DRAFT_26161 [Tuber brumale]|nr:hypothetical protein HOY80DRAFT_26161 [Tuber brumale]
MPLTPQTFKVLEIRCRPVALDTTRTNGVSVQNLAPIADPESQLQPAAHVIDTDYERIYSTTSEAGGEKVIKQEIMQSIGPVKCEERTPVADFALGQPCRGRTSCDNIQAIIDALQMHITAQEEMITFLQRLQEVSLEDCLGRVTGALHAYSLGSDHPIAPFASGTGGLGTQGEVSIIDCHNLSNEEGWAIADGLLHEGSSGRRDFTRS